MKFYPLLLQRFQLGDLLLERRANASLLACGLVERGQLRQIATVTRVDFREALAGLHQDALRFANFAMDRGEVLLDRRH
jgi:hypothetical protein